MTLTRFLAGGRTAGLVVALTMTATLAACSSADSEDSSAGSGDAMSELSAEDGGERSFGAPSGGNDATKAEAPESDTESDSVTSTRTALQTAPIQRHVISTGTVSLISDDVAKTRRDVQRIVDVKQGTISEENTETDDEGVATYSRLVIRVPSSSFAATLLALEESAALRRSQLASEDVTTQVIDTDVRVRAQEGSLRRVEQLLARARSLKDIVWIESQLTQRQSELDSLKSQQAWLSDQTSYSTITIDIERKHADEVEKKKEKKDEPAGFLVGLKGGMKALGAFASAMATIIGALLPFAIVLAVFGVPMWLLVRRTARRRQPKQPATS
ncbi:MAG: hypothetical protein JWN68_1371 [Nocardioides sp.]|jgi:hypothetical protein|uniref:DUF4349 domain-containing protein n=1 Tax=Nocardioides sp. TaxID=35761 RepID=UPI0026140EEB|nr:DUF4349 domain-containing protein [Nocardioides sp.]MCW2833418.1 hypothetical protein [Nocardioides sp.]